MNIEVPESFLQEAHDLIRHISAATAELGLLERADAWLDTYDKLTALSFKAAAEH